ncbi:MAG: RodZ domain-containing protein [Acidimicrobiales bacterium]
MIAAIVVVVLAVLVVTAIVWARVTSARSATKSVETYERALGVLGEVSKRTESTGFRILPHEETGRPHVGRRIDETGGEAPAARSAVRLPGKGQLASSRLPPAGEPKLRLSAPNRMPGHGPVADHQDGVDQEADLSDTGPGTTAGARGSHARPRVPGTAEARARSDAYRSPADRHRQVMVRRAATGTAAAVAVVAVVAAVISLSGGGGSGGKLTTTTTRRGGGGRTTTTTFTTTTLPTSLKPTSVSPSNIAFSVPSGTYTLAFQASTGACWVGIEHTRAGPWLFAQTLDAGQSATYAASGALVVILGAPRFIGITVNGLAAELPSGISQPYNVELTPAEG